MMDMFNTINGRGKTFRALGAKKNTPVGAKGLQLKRHIEATLGTGSIIDAVILPPGEDLREWLAVNTVDMYNAISMLYATLGEFCTDRTCEAMTAGPKYEYLWADGVKIKKPVRLSAPEYIDKLFDWVDAQIDDPNVFPQQFGAPFPPNFMDVTKTVFKRLFRVYAHIYHSHFKQIQALEEEAHLSTCFKHFITFTLHHQLVDEKELAPLQELIEHVMGRTARMLGVSS